MGCRSNRCGGSKAGVVKIGHPCWSGSEADSPHSCSRLACVALLTAGTCPVRIYEC